MFHEDVCSYIKLTNSPRLTLTGKHLPLKIQAIKYFLTCCSWSHQTEQWWIQGQDQVI